MDILPSGHFFKELQAIHDTGYLPAHLSLEDKWEQVSLCNVYYLLVSTDNNLVIYI